MMPQHRMVSFSPLAFLDSAALALAGAGVGQKGKEADHNQKGLGYYKEAFSHHIPKGEQQEAERCFDLAVGEFRQAIAINPVYAEAHRNLARVYYLRKQYKEAADEYRTLTHLEPQDVDAYVQLALTFTHLEQYDEAIRQLEVAKTRTRDPDVLSRLDGYIQKVRERK